MRLQALSLGPEVDVWRPHAGVVHSAFDRAVNLLMAGELWTVLASARQDSPFGIRLAADAAGLEVKAGARVRVRAGYVAIGGTIVDCRSASTWRPMPWTAPRTGLEARLAAVETAVRPRAWAGSTRIADELTAALGRVGPGSDDDLVRAVRRSVGLGPGLTPSADDVLVGILAVITSSAASATGCVATGRLTRALVPVLCRTSDVSRHLLHQALRGLPGRALHELGKAVIEGAPDRALADALARVVATGWTSGADACLGLAAACRLTFSTERAAA